MRHQRTILVSVAAIISFVESSTNTCADIRKFKDVTENYAITGTRFFTLNDHTLVKCAKQCLLRSVCQSYNFELATGICELNKKDSTSLDQADESFEVVPGVVTSDRTAISPVIAGVCSTGCSGNARCIIQPDGTSHCLVECQDPSLANGVITSQIAHDVGSVLTFECDPGFLFFGEAECKVDGTWKSFGCVQGCVNPPTVVDGNLVSAGTVWAVGTVLDYKCTGSKVKLGKAKCKKDFSWTEMKCITPVHNCLDLKSCNNYLDGEYWLVPDSSTPPVKIYCHEMSSATPKEFLTLPEENYVDFSDVGCDPNTGRKHFADCESTRFTKLRISEFEDLKTTSVGLRDYTFTNTTDHCHYIQFGNTNDCHAHSICNEAKTRDYVINTKGTGLKVDPNQHWSSPESSTTLNLLDPFQVVKTDSGRHITVKCHQPCLWCFPIGDNYTFVIDEDLPADMDSATVPVC